MNHLAWRAKLELTVLAPLHVGSGEVLPLPDLEYAKRDGRLVRLGLEKFLEDRQVTLQQKEAYLGRKLPPRDLERLREKIPALYQLVRASGGEELGDQVRECLKMPDHRPYLPGSTVKGVLRTALAAAVLLQAEPTGLGRALAEAAARFDRARAARASRDWSFVGQPMENFLFRGTVSGDAKADPFKALVVADSGPATGLEYRLYDQYSLKPEGFLKRRGPFALEAIPPGRVITVDLSVRQDQLRREGDYAPAQETAALLLSLNDFTESLYFYGNDLAKEERSFYLRARRQDLAGFFDAFVGHPEKGILLPLGFGTGWRGKTIGLWLDKAHQASLKEKSRHETRNGARYHFDAGPISRRLALDAQGHATLPLGWVKARVVRVPDPIAPPRPGG